MSAYPVIGVTKTLEDAKKNFDNLREYFSGLAKKSVSTAGTSNKGMAAENSIAVGLSPFIFQNTRKYDNSVIVSGGTVSDIKWSRDRINFYETGQSSGMFLLSPGDSLKVTYSSVPTMTQVPR